MALVVNPQPFSRDVDRLLDAFFGGEREARRWVPQMDLVEAEDHFVLKADLPGLDESDVSIEVQDGTLTISGERKAEHESRERGWYRIERSFGSFSRSLTLPDRVDPDGISASLTAASSRCGSRSPRSTSRAGWRSRPARRRTAARRPWRAARRRRRPHGGLALRSRVAVAAGWRSAHGRPVLRAVPERRHVGVAGRAAPRHFRKPSAGRPGRFRPSGPETSYIGTLPDQVRFRPA